MKELIYKLLIEFVLYLIQKLLKLIIFLINFLEDIAQYDRRYTINATKLENELGWKTDENFDRGILLTIE